MSHRTKQLMHFTFWERNFSSQTTEVLTGNPESLYLKESIHFLPQMKGFFFYVGILRGILLNLYIALGSMDILTMLILLSHEHRLALCLFVPLLIFSSVPYRFHCIDLSHPWLNLFLSTLLFLMLTSMGLFS